MAVALKFNAHRQQALVWFNYLTYLLMLPAIIGLVISILNSRYRDNIGIPGGHSRQRLDSGRSEVNELIESHFQWQIRSFVIGVVLSMASFGTIYMGVGYFLSIVAVVYWFIRIFHGMYCFANHRAMPGMI